MDNKLYKKFSYTSLIIIDAIPDLDYQTARRLQEDVKHNIKPAEVKNFKVYNRLQFMELMLQIIIETSNNKILPLIHFEGHGSESEFILPDGSKILWSVIADILRVINKKMDNTLVTFFGCCHGFNFIKSMSILKFTPACYIISPLSTIESGLLEQEMSKFYNLLFKLNDITKAKDALNADVMGFLDADKQFLKAINSYFQEKTRGSGWSERRECLISEIVLSDEKWENLNADERKKRLKHYRKFLNNMTSRSKRSETYDAFSMRFLGYIREEARQQLLDLLDINFQQHSKKPGKIA